MKATDLRIGNLFYYRVVDQLDERKEWFEVSEIDYDDLRVIGIKDEMNQDYQPIPLTEEWLLKFGFETSKRLWDSFSRSYYYLSKKDKLCFNLHESKNIFYMYEYKHIKHVHQLQNLYFALTGTELIQNNVCAIQS
jgi:hypothetical protein